MRAFVTARAQALGAEVGEIGVKDVILPGDVRELLNKVVEAERVAKANLIRRQEETAATRSLLNTAKLMEDNPLLLRLKELEALEKLVEKVGRIDLHTGAGAGGFDALLQNLYKLGRDKDERKAVAGSEPLRRGAAPARVGQQRDGDGGRAARRPGAGVRRGNRRGRRKAGRGGQGRPPARASSGGADAGGDDWRFGRHLGVAASHLLAGGAQIRHLQVGDGARRCAPVIEMSRPGRHGRRRGQGAPRSRRATCRACRRWRAGRCPRAARPRRGARPPWWRSCRRRCAGAAA